MTPQELKNSILQLAIQGKLVPQRPEEGNAEDLYKQIQAEKQKLIKEGKIKKEKPLPAITDNEKPFEIPESWKWVKVSDCISNKTGLAYKKTSLEIKSNFMIRVLRGGNILNLNYTFKLDDIFISSEFVKKDLLLRKNTIITPAVTSLENIGKMALIENDYNDVVVGGFVLMLTPHLSNEIFAKYLLYVFSSKYFKNNCKNIVNKSGQAFYNLSREKLMLINIPLPPLAEQKRIVAKIDELLPYVERYEAAYNKLQQLNKRFPGDLQKSVLQLAIQGRLVPQCAKEGSAEELYKQIQAEKQKLIKEGKIKKEKLLPPITDDEKPFEIPENWKWVRLGEVIIFIGGYAYKSNSYVSKSNNQILRLGNIKQDTLLLDAKPVYISDELSIQTKNFKIQINDILITMTGTRRKKDYLYTTKINKNDVKARNLFLNQRVGCFRIVYGLVPEFLLKVLQSEIIRDLIFKKETGTANQGNIGSEDMKEFIYIPLPPFAEQKRIIAKIEEFLSLCDKLK